MRNWCGGLVGLTGLLAALAGAAPARPDAHDSAAARDEMPTDPSRAYEPAKGLSIKPRFMQLPPGAVRPGGWLADWVHAAAEGITGDLDTRAITFRRA
jgi:hypothetical protein